MSNAINESRRRLLRGIVAAPFVITTPNLLMPVRALGGPRIIHLPLEVTPIGFLPALWSSALLDAFYRDLHVKVTREMSVPASVLARMARP